MRPIQEPDVIDRGGVAGAGCLLVAFTAIGVLTAAEVQSCAHAASGGRPFTGSAQLDPPEEVDAIELGRFVERPAQSTRDAEAPELETFGWVDREAGIVRIPLDRAMDVIVERAAAGPGGGSP